MTIDLQPSTAVEGRFRAVVTITLIGAAAAALLVRCLSIAEPLGIDQSLWASAVRGISRGQLLYRDVWEQRPPGIYFIYLAGFNFFGWAAGTVAWLDLLAATATTLLMYTLGNALGGRTAGAAAAALYAVPSIPAGLYGHGGFLERSVCETFIVVAVGLAAWCAVRGRRRPTLAAFAVGLCSGAAIVLKPNAGLYLPAILLWMLLYRSEHAAASRWWYVRTLAAAALGAAVLPLATIMWLWRLDLLAEAKTAVVDYNRYYVSQGFSLGSYLLDFSRAVWLRMKTNALWLSGGVGALVAVAQLARAQRLPPLAGLAVLWGGAAMLAIIVNGARLFNSYFIQAFPPLALMAAWLFTDAARQSAARRWLAVGTGVLMLLATANGHYPSRALTWLRADFDVLRGHIDRTTYLQQFGGYENRRGYSARANEELAGYVGARTRAEEEIFLFGINGAGVYFTADRLTAHRFLRANFFVATDFPDARFRLDAVVADLAARRPRFIIFERLNSPSEMGRAVDNLTADADVAALLQGYRFETQIEDFTLYSRAD